MSFLLPAALLIGILTAAPLIAHALRQGQAVAVPFPAARLVKNQQTTAKSRRRLQDKGLLLLRILLIVGLAALGASPLLSCSRLAVARNGGSSVAVALVLDDSSSMRALVDGRTRFARAQAGAAELLASARPGDAFAVVLAGKPARLVVPATTGLSAVRDSLAALQVTDRPTDLAAALALAQSALDGLPQKDVQLVVLSDFSSKEDVTLPAKTLIALPEIAQPLENCAIAKAAAEPEAILVEIACTSAAAAADRLVQLVGAQGRVLAQEKVAEAVVLPLSEPQETEHLRVRLTPPRAPEEDQIREDDESGVLVAGAGLLIGVRADVEDSGLRTSNSTVLKTALDALESGARLHPLTLLPDTAAELEAYAALLIDDPAGFTPETAEALGTYLDQGGVAMLFLGPHVTDAPLGSDFRPFLEGAPTWTRSRGKGLDVGAELAFGALTEGWSDLEPQGRAAVGEQPEARVLARFQDGEPLLLQRQYGRGLLVVASLPTSVDVSDFALRPAFLALLDHVLHEAGLRNGAAATLCGTPWEIPQGTTVEGPRGPVEPRQEGAALVVEPEVAGRYVLRRSGVTHVRHAIIDPEETLLEPRVPHGSQASSSARSMSQNVDISREIALAVLGLAALELALRLLLAARARRRSPRALAS